MAVIKAFLKQDDAASRINLQAAVGLERNDVGSESAQRRIARLQFFSSSGASEVDNHYLKYSMVPTEEIEVDNEL